MKAVSLAALGCLAFAVLLQPSASSSDCPGICTECRTDAIAVCGAGCVQSVSCSQKDCSCGYSCRAGCYPGSPTGVALKENIFPQSSLRPDGGQYTSSPLAQLNVVEQSAVPLALSDISINNEPGRELSQLVFKVQNQSNSPLRKVSLMLVFLGSSGKPLGGETFCEQLNLKSNDGQSLRVPLKHYVESGQRVWIAFRRFKTDAQSWAGNGDEIIANIRQHEPAMGSSD